MILRLADSLRRPLPGTRMGALAVAAAFACAGLTLAHAQAAEIGAEGAISPAGAALLVAAAGWLAPPPATEVLLAGCSVPRSSGSSPPDPTAAPRWRCCCSPSPPARCSGGCSSAALVARRVPRRRPALAGFLRADLLLPAPSARPPSRGRTRPRGGRARRLADCSSAPDHGASRPTALAASPVVASRRPACLLAAVAAGKSCCARRGGVGQSRRRVGGPSRRLSDHPPGSPPVPGRRRSRYWPGGAPGSRCSPPRADRRRGSPTPSAVAGALTVRRGVLLATSKPPPRCARRAWCRSRCRWRWCRRPCRSCGWWQSPPSLAPPRPPGAGRRRARLPARDACHLAGGPSSGRGQALQRAWLAVLLAAGLALAAYPWLQPDPLVHAAAVLAVPAGAVATVAARCSPRRSRRGRAPRWGRVAAALIALGLVRATAWLPARGIELLAGEPVTLEAAGTAGRPVGRRLALGIVVDSMLANAAALPPGTPVAEVRLERAVTSSPAGPCVPATARASGRHGAGPAGAAARRVDHLGRAFGQLLRPALPRHLAACRRRCGGRTTVVSRATRRCRRR